MTQTQADQWQGLSKYQGNTAGDYQQYLAEMKESISQRMTSFEQQAAQVEEKIAQLEREQQKSKPADTTLAAKHSANACQASSGTSPTSSNEADSSLVSSEDPGIVKPKEQSSKCQAPAGPIRSVLRASG